MKNVLIVGAGKMVSPIVEYLNYKRHNISILNRTQEKAEEIANLHGHASAVDLDSSDFLTVVNKIAGNYDLVISMVPKDVHPFVAHACIDSKTNMLTSSYVTDLLNNMDEQAKDAGIIIVNELGEIPGIDHVVTRELLNKIKSKQGKLFSLESYGTNIPLNPNVNALGYKFAWDPITFFKAAQTAAAYMKDGKRVDVPGELLFKDIRRVKINGETFEVYFNKDATKYIVPFGMDNLAYNMENFSYSRGLLRHEGYCEIMDVLGGLKLFRDGKKQDFNGMVYPDLMASLIGHSKYNGNIRNLVADSLKMDIDSNPIKFMDEIGLFDYDNKIPEEITNVQDALQHLMMQKMIYGSGEEDLVMIHQKARVFYDGKPHEETVTMRLTGVPYEGNSAISRAVGIPVGIMADYMLNNDVSGENPGVHILPTILDSKLTEHMLSELRQNGMEFIFNTKELQPIMKGPEYYYEKHSRDQQTEKVGQKQPFVRGFEYYRKKNEGLKPIDVDCRQTL